jgi:hypothetical protein
MSFADDIRAALGNAAGDHFADSATIEYQNLTSAPNANPRTYSDWHKLAGCRLIEAGEIQIQDPDSGLWFREVTAQLRIPSTVGVALTIRSRVRTAGTTVWAVRQVMPGSAGSVQPYSLAYREPMLQDPRKGGV